MTEFNTDLLDDAAKIIDGRSETHGSPEDSFKRIASYWNTYLSIEGKMDLEKTYVTEADVAEMMALFKLARAQSGEYNDDDYRDRLGYVTLASELRNG